MPQPSWRLRILPPVPTGPHELGLLGERIAARWLVAKGWQLRTTRFRSGHRDIDLVAERNGVVAFVEVKARRSGQFGDPIEAVNWRKQRELRRSAQVWIDRFGQFGVSYRFDVIGVLIGDNRIRIHHIENAFSTPWST